MRRMRASGTRPELALRSALHRRGLRFVVDRSPPGTNRRRRVDVLLRGARVALFVDGCFRHSCPDHGQLPRANRTWWRLKLRGVVLRDRDTDARLAEAGWLVVRVWEHEDPGEAAERVLGLVAARRAATGLPSAGGRSGPAAALPRPKPRRDQSSASSPSSSPSSSSASRVISNRSPNPSSGNATSAPAMNSASGGRTPARTTASADGDSDIAAAAETPSSPAPAIAESRAPVRRMTV
ncbi:hypothetical protein CNX65_08120 [Actinosynnema pretiosum]|uniref:Very-short-patch mismatch repair endonuclease (G-T specific) n=1 Tax=Actinosynnema pretiosum TaxID=42197 RepID=A0A290Z2L8_9PSEU|nr:hypothetical protein CNX65_08120 [Actinosynnema pretiosum]